MSTTIRIAGAGLTGLIAGHAFRGARIFESAPLDSVSRSEHAALLRFRSDAVAKVTGIPFKQVTVQKGIYHQGRHKPFDIALGNMYSRKVLKGTGAKTSGRSILNLSPATRFIAPNDFIGRMRDQLSGVTHYNTSIDFGEAFSYSNPGPILSTVPMPVVLSFASIATGHIDSTLVPEDGEFSYAPIEVDRFELDGVDLYQTIYFPGSETKVYRASITGSTLIVESVRGRETLKASEVADMALAAFGLIGIDFEWSDSKVQTFGKIADLPAPRRRAILRRLTETGNIYSVGRFATWRNVLLDDVVKDLGVIRRMIDSDAYGRELHGVSSAFSEGDDFPF